MATNVSNASELQSAVNNASQGDEIIADPGTYDFGAEITLDTADVTLKATNDAVGNDSNLSILDWSGASDTHGVHIYSDNVTLRGFEIQNTDKTTVNLFNGGGSNPINCTIMRCDVHDSGGYGVYTPGSGHYLQEVYAHNTGKVQDATTFGDGFNASGGDDNTYVACQAWDNRDDAWDLYDSKNNELYHCWAFDNGQISGSNSNGVGGFKLGIKESGAGDGSGGSNYLERCVAYNNTFAGFNDNNTDNANTLVNCTGWDNDDDNFKLLDGENGPVNHILKNCFNIDGTISITSAATEERNSWNLGLDDSAVQSKTPSDSGFLRIPQGSQLIDAGTTVVPSSVQYRGDAPDLGALERWRAVRTHSSPADNATDWHVPFNAMFEDVEEDMTTLAKRIESLRGTAVTVPSLNQPTQGEADWHVPINNNFGSIETTVNSLGTEANGVGAANSVSISLTEPAEGTTGYDADVDSNLSDTSSALASLETALRERESVTDTS